MGKFVDMTGKVFGRWTVLHLYASYSPRPMWVCECTCGAQRPVAGSNLRSGKSTSCGCAKIEAARESGKQRTRHGMRNSTEYRIWSGIKNRCTNPNAVEYPRYGGRGITMHPAWAADFAVFLADVGHKPDGMDSLDRKDNDGSYVPGNVQWATRKTQANNMRTNVRLTHEGQTKTMSEWADALGISYETIQWRVRNGKDVFAPVNKRYSRINRS